MVADSPSASPVLAEATFPAVDVAFLLDLRGWLAAPLSDAAPRLVREVAVVLGELLTNAFRHAGPPYVARLTVPPPGRTVRVEVEDGSPSCPGWTLGRGLLIVRDVCREWDVESRPPGKVAWAEVPVR
jgi:anti-sigma regulatory factor (Ser/Thr protein kinase)